MLMLMLTLTLFIYYLLFIIYYSYFNDALRDVYDESCDLFLIYET